MAQTDWQDWSSTLPGAAAYADLTTTTFTLTGLTNGTPYWFAISATNRSVESPPSVRISAMPRWTQQLGTAGDEKATGVAVDSNGNIYVTGYTSGILDESGGGGGSDIFLVKYNSSGNLEWARQLGTPSGDFAAGVAVGADGAIYVTGSTSGDLDGATNAGLSDLFLLKYDPSGTKQWVRQWGTSGDDEASSVAVSKDGAIYVTGFTNGNLDGNNAGGDDLFLIKYDRSGVRQWIRQLGTPGQDEATGVGVDADGKIYVTGFTNDNLAGNNAGGEDIFLIKYDPSGNKEWGEQVGTPGDDFAAGVAVDADGEIYVTGFTNGDLKGNNAGGEDLFLVKYNSLGVRQWTQQLGTPGQEEARGAAVDKDGAIYVTGFTDGALQGNNAGGDDFFLAQYDSSGNLQWVRQLGTPSGDFAAGVAVGADGAIYVAGSTSGDLDGNTHAGGSDLSLVKYHSSGAKQ